MTKILFITFFCISLLINFAFLWIVITKNPMKVQGDKSWTDLHSDNSDATVKFLKETLNIDVISSSNERGIDYRVVKAHDGLFPFAGVMQISEEHKKEGLNPHATIYLTVDNYDEMHKKFLEKGAKPLLENYEVKNMKFGIYIIPGGLDVGIVQYTK